MRGREAVSVVVVDSIGGGVLDYKRRPFRYLDNLKKKLNYLDWAGSLSFSILIASLITLFSQIIFIF